MINLIDEHLNDIFIHKTKNVIEIQVKTADGTNESYVLTRQEFGQYAMNIQHMYNALQTYLSA